MLFIADTASGCFTVGPKSYPMAVGKQSAVHQGGKREGDGKTPLGRYWVERGYYRADRVARPSAGVEVSPITDQDGWCDAPMSAHYNQHIHLPHDASHEVLVRDDGLYDLVFVLSHNRWPVVAGYGSAIFLHVAKDTGAAAAPKLTPTLGCLALQKADLLELAPCLTRQSWVIVR